MGVFWSATGILVGVDLSLISAIAIALAIACQAVGDKGIQQQSMFLFLPVPDICENCKQEVCLRTGDHQAAEISEVASNYRDLRGRHLVFRSSSNGMRACNVRLHASYNSACMC